MAVCAVLTIYLKKHYQLVPTALRKRQAEAKSHNGEITLALGYRPPYAWDKILKFLAGRAITGIEVVNNDEYLRTVKLQNAEGQQFCGWVRVGHRPVENTLSVTVSESLLPVLPEVLARIKNLFDLYCEPEAVYETAAGDEYSAARFVCFRNQTARLPLMF